MVVMDLKIDNFCMFDNFHVNMSYPKKIVNSAIENEYLGDFENFRYKKVNILMGSNATGKTTLGKMLVSIFNFIAKRESSYLTRFIRDKEKKASIEMDFVPELNELYRIKIELPAMKKDAISIHDFDIEVKSTKISKRDTYEKCAKKLDNSNISKNIEDIPKFGWYFTYPKDADNVQGIYIDKLENQNFQKVLEIILKTLDKSIQKIEKIEKVDNAYAIFLCDRDLIIQNNKLIDGNLLSSGTVAGIDIADLVYSILYHINGFYYCDEKFSYIHSDIEKQLLAIMLSKIGKNEQLFFTTHNLEITDLKLPKHSFNFMKKEQYDCYTTIECISASSKLKKASDTLKYAMNNDMFGSTPDVSLLYELEDIS